MIKMKHNTLTAAALLSLISHVHSWWILGCGQPVAVERVDPIVNPGQDVKSEHLHSVLGGNAFASNLTYDLTQQSTCTTCVVTKDLSNYWTPTVYFHARNGSFLKVRQLGGASIYYQQRHDLKDPEYPRIHAFPRDFRMLAGNPMLRNYTDDLAGRAISYACISGRPEPAVPGFPNHKCGGQLQIRVDFPMCWDGKNVDSDDHKSHVAYPSGLDNGICPESHPKRLIHLFMETSWIVQDFDDQWDGDKQPFALSNGDPTGYSFHGDFFNGWDVDLLQQAIDKCTDNVSDVHKCSVFEGHLQSTDDQNKCFRASDDDEADAGSLPALPGCNPIQDGPQPAKHLTC